MKVLTNFISLIYMTCLMVLLFSCGDKRKGYSEQFVKDLMEQSVLREKKMELEILSSLKDNEVRILKGDRKVKQTLIFRISKKHCDLCIVEGLELFDSILDSKLFTKEIWGEKEIIDTYKNKSFRSDVNFYKIETEKFSDLYSDLIGKPFFCHIDENYRIKSICFVELNNKDFTKNYLKIVNERIKKTSLN